MNTVKKKQNWKEELKELHLQWLKRTAPAFYAASGGHDYKVMKYSDKTANQLTNSIIAYLTFSGHYANRINVQGQARKEKIPLAFGRHMDRITFTPSTTNKGTGDIHAIIQGRHVSIEVKIGKDYMSLNQLKEMERVTSAGGLYFIAKDMQSFVDWYKEKFQIVLNKDVAA